MKTTDNHDPVTRLAAPSMKSPDWIVYVPRPRRKPLWRRLLRAVQRRMVW